MSKTQKAKKTEAPQQTEIISDWTTSTEHPGYRVKVFKSGDATIEVYRPILSDEERKKREDFVRRGCESVLRSYYRRKAEQEQNEQQNRNRTMC